MKIKIITIGFVMLGIISVFAQKTPKPPKVTSTSTSISTVTVDGKQKSNTSISITNTDDLYKLRSHFSKNKTNEIKNLILSEMGRKNLKAANGKDVWTVYSNNNQVYKISLSSGKVSMFIDKNVASSGLVEKFDNIGLLIKSVFSDSDANQAQREADKLQRDAERMKRDAEHMQRESNRLRAMSERDAKRYKLESEKYDERAKLLEEEARHKGGVSTLIKKLLNDNKTLFNGSINNNFNWKWPVFQKEFLSELIKDNIIKNDNQVNLIIDDSGIYINGKKLTNKQVTKYENLFKKHSLYFDNFSFNKENHHIVVLDGTNVDLKKLITALKEKGLITSTSRNLRLEINGSSVVKNGNALPKEGLIIFNTVLQDYNVIPAPGKIIEIFNSGSCKIGYSLGAKKHIGTWVSNN